MIIDPLLSKQSIGGKAVSLVELQKGGYPTPQFSLLTPEDLIVNFQEVNGHIQHAFRQGNFMRINNLLASLRWNDDQVAHDYSVLQKQLSGKVAFRSSAALEDLPTHSFAGIYETVLNVKLEIKSIKSSLLACYGSLYSPRVHTYLSERKLLNQDISTGSIIVQKMFNPTFSGIAFIYPGLQKSTLVYAAGLGEQVVQGKAGHDWILSAGLETPPPPEISQAHCTASWRLLLKNFQKLADDAPGGVDIEWAIQPNDIALLQVRPITSPTITPQLLSDSEDFDCTNIIESYPGTTLPLTYSFAVTAYANVYASFLRLVGIPRQTIQRNRLTLENLLGYIDGQIYYRLQNWYRMIAILPGYRYNKDFFEAMLVPKRKISTKENQSIIDEKSGQLYGSFLRLLLATRFIFKLLFYKNASRKFLSAFERRQKHHASIHLDTLTPQEIIHHYLKLRDGFFKDWSTPILNDFRVMIFHGMLNALLHRISAEHSSATLNSLLTGFAEKEDLVILSDLTALASSIQKDLELRKLFLQNDTRVILSALQTAEKFPQFSHDMQRYIAAYGSRRPGELKLERLSLSEEPSTLIITLQQLVLKNEEQPLPAQNTTGANQSLSETSLITNIGNPVIRSFFQFAIHFLARHARAAIRQREQFRFKRGQVFQIARECFIALGKQLVENRVIDQSGDIFFLTTNEIFTMVNNDRFEKEFRTIVRERKKINDEYDHKSKRVRRIQRFGFGRGARDICDDENKEIALSGQGASPGIISGPALVLTEFSSTADYRGKILVTYHTDPGWTIIFPLLKGIILEKGNTLSHGAILSRELGIPCIVKSESALARIKNGDILEMDGTTGSIRFVKK